MDAHGVDERLDADSWASTIQPNVLGFVRSRELAGRLLEQRVELNRAPLQGEAGGLGRGQRPEVGDETREAQGLLVERRQRRARPTTPSCIASICVRRMASGVRSSCATSAANMRRRRSSSSIVSAIWLNALAISPSSSGCLEGHALRAISGRQRPGGRGSALARGLLPAARERPPGRAREAGDDPAEQEQPVDGGTERAVLRKSPAGRGSSPCRPWSRRRSTGSCFGTRAARPPSSAGASRRHPGLRAGSHTVAPDTCRSRTVPPSMMRGV